MRRLNFLVLVFCVAIAARLDAATEETLEPIVVTGPNAEADAQQASASITVFTSDEIESAAIDRTADVAVRAPNLILREGGGRNTPFFSIRGMVNANFGEPSVPLYVDELPYGDVRFRMIDLFDVERVEVYRGPQPTRFGRNAEAGAISISTRPPRNRLGGQVSLRYGNNNTQIYQVSASIPLATEKVLLSLAGMESRRNGYIENEFLDTGLDDRDMLGGRGKLLLLPAPDLEIAITGEVQESEDGGRAFTLLHQTDPFEVRYNVRGQDNTYAYLAGLKVAYTANWFRLTTIGTRQSYSVRNAEGDLDFTPLAVAAFSDEYAFDNWTGEIRLTSTRSGQRWSWQIGGYFEDRNTAPEFTVRFDSTDLIQAPPPTGLGLPFTSPVRDVQRGDIHSRTAAGFAQSTAELLDHLELTLGMRYERFTGHLDRTHELEAPAQGVSTPLVPPIGRNTESSAWLPIGTLSYRVRPPILVYGTVARGYRAGGFSPLTDDAGAVKFDPQFDVSYELGLKSTWFDERLVVNLALFHLQADDYQVIQRVGLTGFTVANAERVTSRGFEVELGGAVVRDFEFAAAFGYTDAHYDRFRDAMTGGQFDGNDVQLVPEYNFALALQYRHPRGIFARIEGLGVGAYSFLEDNVAGQDAYQLLNVTLGSEWKHIAVHAYGKNLTDTEYFHFALAGGPGGDLITTPGDPRTYGFMVTARF